MYHWPRMVIYMRHGDKLKDKNLPNQLYPLSPEGVAQCERAHNFLISPMFYEHVVACFVSLFERTEETFKRTVRDEELEPIRDARLNEFWKGIWYTLHRDKIAQFYPNERQIKDKLGLYFYSPPQGESFSELEVRVHSFINMLRLMYSKQVVFIAGHGNWEIAFQRIIENKSRQWAEAAYQEKPFASGSISIYTPRDMHTMQLERYIPQEDMVGTLQI